MAETPGRMGANLVFARLPHWCDEASCVRWEQEGDCLPTAAAAYQRLRDTGTLSNVRHPNPAHAAGQTTGNSPPRPPAEFPPAGLDPADSARSLPDGE